MTKRRAVDRTLLTADLIVRWAIIIVLAAVVVAVVTAVKTL
jgi:hypothetical protein